MCDLKANERIGELNLFDAFVPSFCAVRNLSILHGCATPSTVTVQETRVRGLCSSRALQLYTTSLAQPCLMQLVFRLGEELWRR